MSNIAVETVEATIKWFEVCVEEIRAKSRGLVNEPFFTPHEKMCQRAALDWAADTLEFRIADLRKRMSEATLNESA